MDKHADKHAIITTSAFPKLHLGELQSWIISPSICKVWQGLFYFEGWGQDYSNSNIFLKPLFRGNLDPFVNNANLGVIAHMSNGT